jgi:hypothetical protein
VREAAPSQARYRATAKVTSDQLDLHAGDRTSAVSFDVGNPPPGPSPSPNRAPVDVTDGPLVTSALLMRGRSKGGKTEVRIGFNMALIAATAENLSNYTLTTRRGLRIQKLAVWMARYDAATNSVELGVRGRVNWRAGVTLVISGARPAGLLGANGKLLDGTGSGTPGSDFAGVVKV